MFVTKLIQVIAFACFAIILYSNITDPETDTRGAI